MTNHQQIHQSTGCEWYTPAPYIEAARACMGTIDLDPASNEIANQTVKATHYLTQQQNGLLYKWRGNVWLNPPYGVLGRVSNQALWSQTLIRQFAKGYTARAVLLVNAQTGEKWFKPLWEYHICFTYRRIKFIDQFGIENPQPTHSNAFIGLGIDFQSFRDNFKQFGECVPSRKLRDHLMSLGYWSL